MVPSNNLFALVRAFDLTTPPSNNKEEFRSQGQVFLNELTPYVEAIIPLFKKGKKHAPLIQFRFDALVSVAYDIGIELFLESPLSDVATSTCSKRALRKAFLSVPSFTDTLRPELAKQMLLFGMPTLSRREIEFRLFIGEPTFAIGRCKDPSENSKIVYSVSVMHPLIQFLSRNN